MGGRSSLPTSNIKKLVVLDEPTYQRMAAEHISKDKPITEDELRSSQRILNATAKPLINIFNIGASQPGKNRVRCWDNASSEACEPAKLSLLPKIHRVPKENGDPHSRPLVAANVGVSTRAGNLIARVLEPMVALALPRMEDLSTEEAISQLNEASDSLRQKKVSSATVSSLDVKSLYPSIPHEDGAKEVAKFVLQSDQFNVENFDTRMAQTFIASNMTPEQIKAEGIENLIPDRVSKMGNRPGKTTTELTMLNDNNTTRETKWKTKAIPNNQTTIRKLCSLVLQLAVLNVFQEHCYTFDGIVYKQVSGCPIGLKLTGMVAQIIMDSWTRQFLMILDRAKLELHLLVKYVDDINIVLETVNPGTVWDNKTMKIEHDNKPCEQNEPDNTSVHNATYRLILNAANSIFKYLKFTIDTPENHLSNKVPMLDLETWTTKYQDTEGHEYCQLLYRYYEKPVTPNRVTHADSSYTWRNKTMSLTMETFRRMRNNSPQLDNKENITTLQKFLRKLKRSGYLLKTRSNIIVSGVTYYIRNMRIELQGGPSVNRRSEKNVVGKQRLKLGTTDDWYRRRRGGVREAIRKENDWRKQHNMTTTNQHNRCKTQDNKPTYNPRTRYTRKPMTTSNNMTTYNTTQTMPQNNNKTPEHQKIEATLTVNHTTGSNLCSLLQESEDKFSQLTNTRKVRIIEKGGTKLVHALSRKDSNQNDRICNRPECQNCKSRMIIKQMITSQKEMGVNTSQLEKKWKSVANCRRENVVYQIDCLTCLQQPNPTTSTYTGESGRSPYQRMREHFTDLKYGDTKSPLVTHAVIHHESRKPEYLMRTLELVKGALRRIVMEAVFISCKDPTTTNMNRKTECVLLPKLEVTGTSWKSSKKLKDEQENNNKCEQTGKKRKPDNLEGILNGEIKRITWKNEDKTTKEVIEPERSSTKDRKEKKLEEVKPKKTKRRKLDHNNKMNRQPQDPTLLNTDIRYRNQTEEISNQDTQQIPNKTTNVHPLPPPPHQEQTFTSVKPTDTREIPDTNPTIPTTTMITPTTPPPHAHTPPPKKKKYPSNNLQNQ